eukprot:10986357-Lingulodinium_polyedra.AAC.1
MRRRSGSTRWSPNSRANATRSPKGWRTPSGPTLAVVRTGRARLAHAQGTGPPATSAGAAGGP